MPDLYFFVVLIEKLIARLVLAVHFVRNSQFLTTLCATCSEHAASVGSQHTFAEAMLVISLTIVRLKSTFHFLIIFISDSTINAPMHHPIRNGTLSGCKFRYFFPIIQSLRNNIAANVHFSTHYRG